jgi:acyl-CoA dehydrogenase
MIRTELVTLAAELRPILAEQARNHDRDGTFVEENYSLFKKHRVFSLGVPSELGGGGASHSELCWILRELGESCGSSALALSMHTHLVAAAVFRYKNAQPGEQLLRRVAADEAVLVSTGAGDWLSSNGRMVPVEGGYRVSARKAFASGSPRGDLLITSAAYEDAPSGPAVLHFGVSLRAEGVRVLDDWDTMGMRGTGSNTVELENVFVPSSAIVLERARGVWHNVWNVVIGVAAPLYMAPYLGVARAAASLTRRECKSRANDPALPYVLGEIENALTAAELAHDSMIALANDYQFKPSTELASAMLIRKTLLTRAMRDVADKAIEAVGGAAYFRRLGLERLSRDLEGAQFHPLPEKRQQLFTGRLVLGLEPIA